ncbi:MAG: twin-arginine translocase subunit TatB [Methylococcales bacterium]|nr:twin-arginine translocase subunit TatB [Methylococcales bacterium]MCK5925613.1 twin-arginine translocase subunit TatB [Methylococcales bacterium]
MFDIGFWELSLVGLVSLIVIGPEQLPKVARIAGFWIGKTRNMVASVKSEIHEELQAEEMRQIMAEQADSLDDIKQTFKETTSAIKQSTSSIKQSLTDQTDESK